MKTIRIFLASSAELEVDRKEFEANLYRKSKSWKDERNLFLELNIWEDFIDAMSKTRLQDEYNKAILGCELFVMLFWTKVGPYTNEEFDTAHRQFQKTGKPLIYTYFKAGSTVGQKQESLEKFCKKLTELGHFQTVYKNTEDLLLKFNNQLEKLFKIETRDEPFKHAEIKMTKDQIFEFINKGDYLDAFDKLNQFFLGKNDSLNALMGEYINQPNNFNQAQFSTRLKLFISRNW